MLQLERGNENEQIPAKRKERKRQKREERKRQKRYKAVINL
jgi:hypothetical protein